LAAVARAVRKAAPGRRTLIFAENESQDAKLLRSPEQGGYGLDAGWNDDFHHVARVAMTGHNQGYYGDYSGTAQELISAIKWGHLYQGQWNARQQRYRGTPALDLAGPKFVVFLENHDQVGNSPQGRRIHQLTSPGRHRALTALLALAPGTPLLFQGQEYSATTAFHYFADHAGELGKLVSRGRRDSLRDFRWAGGSDTEDHFADPCDVRTFESSKLDPSERLAHGEAYDLHCDLFRMRREDPVFSAQNAERIHGSVLGSEAFLLRYFGDQGHDRLLIVNLGRDFQWAPAADPLLAPPTGTQWRLMWSSESPRYGGSGTAVMDGRTWFVPGHAAIVLASQSTSQTR
ncbi:MAG TPA: DUF3459 domain-containing protein, partial [Pirellulales bacterium]|nr:DUF3459 domain-containing protein [Pirellulales bacterium]